MKKVIIICALLFSVGSLFAQSPNKMSYQAVIRDASNNLVSNATVGSKVSIIQGSPTGTVVFEENHSGLTNNNGLLSLEIGGGTATIGSISAIDWKNGPYFIKNETDPTGGTNYTISGTSELLSVPYALHAKNGVSSGNQNQTLTNNMGEWTADSTLLVNPNSNYVGINRNTPIAAEIFQVHQNVSPGGYGGMYINTDELTGKPFYGFATNGFARSWFEYTGAEDKLVYSTWGTSGLFSITNNKKVGIGTASPTNVLEVVGITGGFEDNGIRIENGSANTGWSFYSSSSGDMIIGKTTNLGTFNGTSGAYTSISDERLKTNIRPIDNVLSKVNEMNIFQYEFKYNNPQHKSSIGVIAQELQQSFPELVSVNESNEGNTLVENQLGVDYAGLSVVAIKAIQEQQKIIDEQQRRIDNLIQRIESLEKNNR